MWVRGCDGEGEGEKRCMDGMIWIEGEVRGCWCNDSVRFDKWGERMREREWG